MIKKSRLALITLLVIAAAIIALVVFMPKKAPELQTAEVTLGTVQKTVDISGTVAYPDARRVSFATGGRVASVNVRVGDAVNRGAVLASLESYTTYSATGEASTTTPSVTSPIDGVVTSLLVAVGEIVGPGQVVAVIEGPRDTFNVIMAVSENDIPSLDEGDDVTIYVDPISDDIAFSGIIRDIAPTSMNSEGVVFYQVTAGLYGADAAGKGAYGDIRAGMSATVVMVLAQDFDALYIPQRAVITRDGESYVRVPADNDDGYEERLVVTGLRGDDSVIVITGGLEGGDTVITKIEE